MRPSRRVSASRISRRRGPQRVRRAAAARRRWRVRTAAPGSQWSSVEPVTCRIVPEPVGLIQHKREAYWFYRFLSLGYDRWVNPLFWTPAMRAQALEPARLDGRRADRARRRRRHRLHHRGDRAARRRVERDDARPESRTSWRAPRQAGARATARACSATPRTCRSPTTRSTATSPPARSSTGPTRSAASPRPTA